MEEYKKPRFGYNTFMFGYNKQGICGQPIDEFIKDPAELNIGQFVNIDCGYHHTMAIDHNGVLYSWGRNRCGQLG